MDREAAIRKILTEGTPTFYYLGDGSTEYVLFRNIPSFWAMYSDYPYTVEFLRVESDRVVDKGVVGKSEEKRIKAMRPDFVLREWQGKDPVAADHHDDGRQ
jgi:hypothetical protein